MSIKLEVNEWVGDVGVERLWEGETVGVAGFATGARNGKGGWRSGGLVLLRTWDNSSKVDLGRRKQAFALSLEEARTLICRVRLPVQGRGGLGS